MRCLLVLEDKELLDKARQGNKYCLNLLLQNNYQMLYGFLIKLTGDKDLAEDLVQDTLLKASLNITKFRGDSKFSSYLITIGINTYKNYLRKNKVRTENYNFEFKVSHYGEDDLINHIRFKEALNHLNNMPYEKRISFILKHYYGYSIEEISEILKVSSGTTKSRIHNTIKKLREILS